MEYSLPYPGRRRKRLCPGLLCYALSGRLNARSTSESVFMLSRTGGRTLTYTVNKNSGRAPQSILPLEELNLNLFWKYQALRCAAEPTYPRQAPRLGANNYSPLHFLPRSQALISGFSEVAITEVAITNDSALFEVQPCETGMFFHGFRRMFFFILPKCETSGADRQADQNRGHAGDQGKNQ